MENTKYPHQKKGLIYAGITAFFWGFLAIFIKMAVAQVTPQTLVWFRFVVAFIILLAFFVIYRPKDLSILIRPPWLLILTAGVLALNYFGFANGVKYTSPNNAQVFIQSGAMLLAVAGVVVFKEKLTRSQLLGYGVAGAGFYLFYSDQIEGFGNGQSEYIKGVIWTLIGGVSWTLYAVLQKFLVRDHPTQKLNLFIFGFCTLLYLPTTDFSFHLEASWTIWVLLIFLGLNTLIAYGCLAEALKYAEATKISVIITLNPIITFVTTGIFTAFHIPWIDPEYFTVKSILGAAFVISGVIMVILKKSGKRNG